MALHDGQLDPSSVQSDESSKNVSARLTVYVLLSCMVAASAGFIYGYDLVIAGGISIMDDFLEMFYPKVFEGKKSANQDMYCKYNNEVFQLFSSSLYLGAIVSSFVASFVTRRYGRKASMLIAGFFFIFGTLLGALAYNLPMILCGRVLIGLGLGCSNQAVPLYISEIAPPHLRGGFIYIFGLNVGGGILIGNIVNYLAEKVHPWGWRISLSVLGVPALFFTLSSLMLFETPTSLIQQGHHNKARHVLAKLRGSNQVVGSDALLFYGVFIFKAAGFGNGAALYSAIIVGSSSLTTTFITLLLVDRIGRRKLLLGGSTILLLTMVIITLIFAIGLRNSTQAKMLGQAEGIGLVVTLCVFAVTFGSSLGPLGWLIPSELYSLQVRSLGLAVTVVVNMLFKFIIAQTFLSMLCALKYGTFILCGGFSLLLLIFVALFLPETNGIPLHAMQDIWESHWLWKRFSSSSEDSNG